MDTSRPESAERPRNEAGEALCFACHKPQKDHWQGLECTAGPDDARFMAAREQIPYSEREGFRAGWEAASAALRGAAAVAAARAVSGEDR